MERLTIERLGHRGDGIAPGPTYVPLTLPGEVVEGEMDDGQMRGVRILEPSSDRVRPPCPHFRRCGGCSIQHATNDFVEAWKIDLVRSALKARDLSADIRRIHTSPPNSRRRAVLAGIRTKSGAMVGFHERASHAVVATPDCRVLHPDILAAMPLLEALTRLGSSRKGEIRLSVIASLEGIDVAVGDAKELDTSIWSDAVASADAHDVARLSWNGDVVVERRPPRLKLGAADVVPPPGAFLQATIEGEAALQAGVKDAIGNAGSVIDLFAGIGTFALPLAMGAEVHAVEGDRDMLASLDAGWRHGYGQKRLTTETRDLFRRPFEPGELARFEAAVIDPPRAGAEAQSHRLAQGGPSQLAMVSCNPQSFARDARLLIDAGYTIDWIDVVDQFRWSSHVELVAKMTR